MVVYPSRLAADLVQSGNQRREGSSGFTLWRSDTDRRQRRSKLDLVVYLSRLRLLQVLMGVLFLYLLFMSFEIPLVFRGGFGSVPLNDGSIGFITDALPLVLKSEEEVAVRDSPSRPSQGPLLVLGPGIQKGDANLGECLGTTGWLSWCLLSELLKRNGYPPPYFESVFVGLGYA